MQYVFRVAALLALSLALPTAAGAQQGLVISVNGGLRPLSGEFSDTAIFTGPAPVYTETVAGAATGEASRFDGGYLVEPGPVIDVGGGVRLWQNYGVGVSASLYQREADVSLMARLPHPFFLGSARAVTGSSSLRHEELATHLYGFAELPANPAFTVTLFGGPTVFMLRQDLVTDISFTQSYPYDEALFGGVVTREHSQSKIGFNVGADVAYYFTETVGVGWLTRFSQAVVSLPSVGDRDVSVRVGGLHATGGLRLRF